MARLVLTPGQTFGFLGNFDQTDVIGSNQAETVLLQSVATATFDASFNQGGDELIIDGNSSTYTGQFLGSNFVLSSAVGTNVLIPFGTAGITLTFNDGSAELRIENQNLMLGDQVITNEAATLDGLNGEMAAPAAAALDVPAAPLFGMEALIHSGWTI